jgi:hypothetical protein
MLKKIAMHVGLSFQPMHNVPVFLGLGTTGLKGQAHSQIGLFLDIPFFI